MTDLNSKDPLEAYLHDQKWQGMVLMGQVSPKSLAKGEDNWRRRWVIKGEEEQQGRGFRKIERRKREKSPY